MPINDPIGDMLTRIRNAISMERRDVWAPHSKIKVNLLKLLKSEGFIDGFAERKRDGHKELQVYLRYYDDSSCAIHGLRRVSKPGLRKYVGKDDIPTYYGGLGAAFISTPQGIMTGPRARAKGVGGELLFYVW